jgi:hypothetical protein
MTKELFLTVSLVLIFSLGLIGIAFFSEYYNNKLVLEAIKLDYTPAEANCMFSR